MIALPKPRPSDDHRCPSCPSVSLTSGRLSHDGREPVEFYACDACGDFWFERAGTRLTASSMRDLGLIS